jgi:hypothetical protein
MASGVTLVQNVGGTKQDPQLCSRGRSGRGAGVSRPLPAMGIRV